MGARFTPDSIRDALQRLPRTDTDHSLFGSRAHQYVLNPPIEIDSVLKIEEQAGVRLPEDYRVFITEIGNGWLSMGHRVGAATRPQTRVIYAV